MGINKALLPKDLEDRLNSWARYFRDRRRFGQCGSAEGNFRPHSGDFAKEGWGDPAPPDPQLPARSRGILEAIETNAAIIELSATQKWAITYYYCYRHLKRHIVLKAMRKFTGRRINWEQFSEQVNSAHVRLNYMIYTARLTKAA